MKHDPRSILSGLLVILGCWELYTGFNWMLRPTPSRIAGIAWMDLPITEHTIGWMFVIGGSLTLLGGLFSHWKVVENIGTALGIFVPLAAAAPFVGAFIDTGDPSRLQTVVSYATYSIFILWAARQRVVTLPKREGRPDGTDHHQKKDSDE